MAHPPGSKRVIRWFPAQLAVFVPLMLVGCLALLWSRLPAWWCKAYCNLKASDLLAYFGVTAGILYAQWAYAQDQNNKAEAEREELEQSKPCLTITQQARNGRCPFRVTNLGPQRLRRVSYEEQVIAQVLSPGSSISFLLTAEDESNLDDLPSHTAIIEPYEPVSDEGIYSSLALCSYDSAGRLWETEFRFNNDESVGGQSNLLT